MKKFLLYFIPIFTITSFIFILNSGFWLKKPFGNDDQLYEAVHKIEVAVKEKQWDTAKENIEYAETAWRKIVRRIQFSVEKEYIIDISGTLSRIKGVIEGKDEKAIMEETYYFYELWDNLAK
ncbi:DUF4363 family protein [Bacillus sp. DJP31]|uniref:DUF4363 family protein n=1 Tax=Bacillus sp. DJP31 TaxID=3409789 RepID=UPI003BB6C319